MVGNAPGQTSHEPLGSHWERINTPGAVEQGQELLTCKLAVSTVYAGLSTRKTQCALRYQSALSPGAELQLHRERTAEALQRGGTAATAAARLPPALGAAALGTAALGAAARASRQCSELRLSWGTYPARASGGEQVETRNKHVSKGSQP